MPKLLKDRLVLQKVTYDIILTYYCLYDNFEGWTKSKAMLNWRLEMVNLITRFGNDNCLFITELLRKEDSKVYLEFSNLLSQYNSEQIMYKTPKPDRKTRIINYIKKLINVRSNKREKVENRIPILTKGEIHD